MTCYSVINLLCSQDATKKSVVIRQQLEERAMKKISDKKAKGILGGAYYRWYCYTGDFLSAKYYVYSECDQVRKFHVQRYPGHQTIVKTYA